MAKQVTGISRPYGKARASAKVKTSAGLRQSVRDAIGEPHIDLNISISRVFPGEDPAEGMWTTCLDYREFIDDGMSSPNTGLKLSAVEACSSLLDFEQKIEAWYTSRGWTVVPDK